MRETLMRNAVGAAVTPRTRKCASCRLTRTGEARRLRALLRLLDSKEARRVLSYLDTSYRNRFTAPGCTVPAHPAGIFATESLYGTPSAHWHLENAHRRMRTDAGTDSGAHGRSVRLGAKHGEG